ncbi:MAG: hypothetical protein IPM71_08820 [Bacteroidota bacterium]|nr:MAG: hypothetical protein IPM71_08820 [Bacteroidota bacterium]
MHFFLSKTGKSNHSHHFFLEGYYLHYTPDAKNLHREVLIETDERLIIGDVNQTFYAAVSADPTRQNIEIHIKSLSNGYLLLADKKEKSFYVYTDIFGFYSLFLLEKDNGIYLSSEFRDLIEHSSKKENVFALLDILLFNYTLLDRTLLVDVKRLPGGSRVVLSGGSETEWSVPYNYAGNFQLTAKSYKINSQLFAQKLQQAVLQEISTEIPNFISMTGGFDSRAILASLVHNKQDINTITYGQPGNIESETLKSFIGQFAKGQLSLLLDEHYLEQLPVIFEHFLEKNLDNPVFFNLVEYEQYSAHMPPANLIIGFMGGEIINGQALGAEVTFTRFAARLLQAKDYRELLPDFEEAIHSTGMLNTDYINSFSEAYLKTLSPYFVQENNLNILQFVINEEYAKFFGAANKVFKASFNVTVPFIQADFLNFLLNSQISFLRKALFKQNPLRNVKSKILFARAIAYLCPALKPTRFDRLYRVKDLSSIFLWPLAAYYYFLVHAFRKSNKQYTRTTDYLLWYKNILWPALEKPCPYLNKDMDKIIDKSFTVRQKHQLYRLAALILSLDKIKAMGK